MRAPTRFDESRSSSLNGVTFSARRRADPKDWLLGLVFGGALAISVLLAITFALGLAWVIVVIVQDLGRRLAGG